MSAPAWACVRFYGRITNGCLSAGKSRGENMYADYTCRCLVPTFLGREFDSPRLHQKSRQVSAHNIYSPCTCHARGAFFKQSSAAKARGAGQSFRCAPYLSFILLTLFYKPNMPRLERSIMQVFDNITDIVRDDMVQTMKI